MPTARELLEQAEALMRRDRMAAIVADDDFPLLTDAVPDVPDAIVALAVTAPPPMPLPASGDDIALPPANAAPPPLSAPLEEPLVRPEDRGPTSIWGEPLNDDDANTATGPDSFSPVPDAVPDPTHDIRPDPDAAWHGESLREVAGTSETPAVVADEVGDDLLLAESESEVAQPGDDFPVAATLDATRWNLMAEDIRMQVLQRIDIFTDTGLKDQLKERLQPIVDRASADLVASVSQHVGQLLRAYVAEAIEREIEKWRQEPR